MRSSFSTMPRARLLFAALLAVLLASCGGTDKPTVLPDETVTQPVAETVAPADTAQPTTLPTMAPTIAPSETPEPTAAAPGEELDLAGLSTPSGLDSYRATMQIMMEGTGNGQEISGRVDLLTEYTRDPLAQYVRISGEGTEGFETSTVELFREGDTAYMNLDGEWLTLAVSGAGDDLLEGAGIIGPNEVLTDTCGWKGGEQSDLRGIRVEHWTLDKENLQACMTAAQLESLGDLSAVSGDLYVAVDGRYPLQMDLIFAGEDLDFGMEPGEPLPVEGQMEFHYQISDINQPLSIQVPEEAIASGGTPDEVPLADDAEALNNIFGVITYVSSHAVEDLAAFYVAEMPNRGWSQVSVEEFGGVHILEYAKENRRASVMIEADEETNRSAVLIAIQEGEE